MLKAEDAKCVKDNQAQVVAGKDTKWITKLILCQVVFKKHSSLNKAGVTQVELKLQMYKNIVS